MDILSIGLSGLTSSRMRALDAANNLANLNTPGYGYKPGEQPATTVNAQGDTVELSNVDVAEEAVALRREENATRASAAIVRTGDEMMKETIDLIA
ncbi:hypothetical protein K8I31_14165 [bacterium]|nr:hypothetical protein [bacterium]